MTESKENVEYLVREFEQIIVQEDLTSSHLKDYLYNRGEQRTPFIKLVLEMHEIQSKKRQLHRKIRSLSNTLH